MVYQRKPPPSLYNLFLAEKMTSGMTLVQAMSAWKLQRLQNAADAERRALEILQEAAHREKVLVFEKNKKARTIQKHWLVAISNPSFKLCRDRLMNEFNSMA